MIPIFVKGTVGFSIDVGGRERVIEFPSTSISVWGVHGLPWGPLSPELHFGREVEAKIDVPSLKLQTTATITREATRFGQHMGLRFRFATEPATQLAELIRHEGFFPTEYLRKYPRIPSLPMIQTFPLRALILPENEPHPSMPPGTPEDPRDLPYPISLDVENLSPNGVLISSENQQTLSIKPGAVVNLLLEPRGWFPMPIAAQGLVCRIGDELSERTGNMVRTMGIKFTRIDAANRSAFVDLLKDILERFKRFEPEKRKR